MAKTAQNLKKTKEPKKIGKEYNHLALEKKIQKEWDIKKIYKTEATSKKKPYYVLDMFPYPSGAGLHVGHPRGYIGSDVFARFKRMNGFNVLHPMGFDAFGLPAEQYAIQTGKHPSIITKEAIKRYKKQLEQIGFSYDWSREVQTIDPDYYKWTQFIFLKIYNSFFDTNKQKAQPIEELVKVFEKEGNEKANDYTAHSEVETFSKTVWKNFSPKEKQDILMKYRMAYEGYAQVNWCKELGTVLANDEVIEKDGTLVSERGEFPVEKKSMRQWFMRISAYGDRLIDGLDLVDFEESTKETQKNWIGKSEGSEIEFKTSINRTVKVFTTRADTLFGVTYIVLSPEHPNIGEFLVQSKNMAEVSAYVRETKENMQKDSGFEEKEKTGIVLDGIYAINPVNGEQVPVWVGNYVLASYGTGAVMAVPAHDERDYEFAKKYDLPVKQVIAPARVDDNEPPREGKNWTTRNAVECYVYDKNNNKYLFLEWLSAKWKGVVTGGIEKGEDIIEAGKREVLEETGYKNLRYVRQIGISQRVSFYHPVKDDNRKVSFTALLYELVNHEKIEVDSEELIKHRPLWLTLEEGKKFVNVKNSLHFLENLENSNLSYADHGVLINSSQFDDLTSEEAKKEITKFVGGKLVTKYKMRDAIFARQRYWGEPIPLIHDKKTGLIKEVPMSKLPLKLPNVKSYKPTGTGESPLAGVASWVKAGYETNTMPGWAGSSWYFLRYLDPKNKKKLVDEKTLMYWSKGSHGQKAGLVDMYIGGTEHNTGHLLYARFWHKVLFDLGIVQTQEPFGALRHQGMIGGADGRKMSKRWGNVINPDDVVATYGADTLRVFEMFLGPFGAHLPWSEEGIIGSRRFVERVWRVSSRVVSKKVASEKEYSDFEKTLHKTIKKVTEDIETFNFNTAVSSLMICLNSMEKQPELKQKDFLVFLQILAPFAPYIADGLWSEYGGKGSIHHAPWPTYNEALLIETTITLGVQVNGKVRGEIEVEKGMTEEAVRELALAHPGVSKYLTTPIKKFIYIQGKIISIVV